MTQSSPEQPQARLTDSEDAVVVNHSVDTVVQPSSNESEEQAQPQEVVSSVTPSLPSLPSAELSSNKDQQAPHPQTHNTQTSDTADEAQPISSNPLYLQGYSEGFKQANQQWLETQIHSLTQEVVSLKATQKQLQQELEVVRSSLSSHLGGNDFFRAGQNQTNSKTIKKATILVSSTQENLKTEVGEGHSATNVVSGLKNPETQLYQVNQLRKFKGLEPLASLSSFHPEARETKETQGFTTPRSTQSSENKSQFSESKSPSSGNNALPSWFEPSKYFSLKDAEEFQRVELEGKDSQEFLSLLANLKSPTTARLLHFFFSGFGIGYLYVGKSRWKYHLAVSITYSILFAILHTRVLELRKIGFYAARELEQTISLLSALNFLYLLWLVYLFVMLFFIGRDARKANSFLVRDWLVARGYPVDPEYHKRV